VPVLSLSAFLEDRARFPVVTLPAGRMMRALIRAAQITLLRAILKNFPPGPERGKRLQWLAWAVLSRQEAMQALRLLKQRDP
jgi:hypothetical protein